MKKWFHFGAFSNLSLTKNIFWCLFAAWFLWLVRAVLNFINHAVLSWRDVDPVTLSFIRVLQIDLM